MMNFGKLLKKHKNGLIAPVAIIMFLTGCVTPKINDRIVPVYSQKFLTGVADEYEASIHGPYTKEVVKDWMVMVGL